MERTYRAGQSIEDRCRQCHDDRLHTIIVVDAAARPLRVRCDYCGSEHNFRGGPRTEATTPTTVRHRAGDTGSRAAGTGSGESGGRAHAAVPESLVSDRERRYVLEERGSGTAPLEPGDDMSTIDLETLLRRVIREESGLTPVAPAEKWRGGDLVLRPGKPGLQEKRWPIDTFFHKIVMLRNRLRTLEQQVNASDLPEDQKVKLQSYITGCYGSLTSFNVLFADEDDRFVGASDE